MSVAFVPSTVSKRWNAKLRGKRRPTDVLAFPLESAGGELLLDRTLLRRQARTYGWPLRFEYARLTLHGALHLAGYDHRTIRDRERMESRERTLLTGLFPRLRNHPTVRQHLRPQ